MKHLLFWILFTVGCCGSCALVGCNKETAQPTQSEAATFEFTSLTADSTAISIGSFTKITALAKGNGLTYTWSATAGDILGSGAQITYGAASCCAGVNGVTCTVEDGRKNSTAKTVSITVQ